MSNYFITGFDTTMGDTINYVDLGQVFMDISNNQIVNGFVSYQNNPINRLTFNNPNQFVNKLYVDNSNLASVNNIIFQAVTFTPMLTPVNFTNTIEYPTNVLITKSDITFKQNNLYNAPANDQIYTFGAGTRVTGGVAGGGIWVAAGSGTYTLAYSYDGINWYPSSTTVFTTACYAVAWNGSIWVAMGAGTNGLAYSYDGINWVGLGTSVFQAAADSGLGSNLAGSFAWNGIMWVGFGSYTGTANNFIYSYDGIQWFGNGQGGLSGFVNHGGQIAWNGTLFVAATNNQSISNLIYSYDGIKWFNALGNNLANSTLTNAVAWNGTIWAAVANNTVTFTSRDGVNWNTSGTNPPNWGSGTGPTWMIWTGEYFIVVGQNNAAAYFISYTGNSDWLSVANIVSANNYQPIMIAYNGTMFLMPTNNNNNCWYSYSGGQYGWLSASTWPFTTRANFVAWGGRKENVLYLPQSRVLALGSGVTSSVAYAYDGSANWIGGNLITSWGAGTAGIYYNSTRSMAMFSSGNGAAWDGTKWVAAGTPNIVPTYITPLTVPSSLNFLSNTVGAGNVSYFAPGTGVNQYSFFAPSMPGYPNANWPQSAWSIEAWIRIPATGSNANGMGIVGSLNTNFGIGTTATNYNLTVAGASASDTFALNDGNWHYVAVTVNSGVVNGSFYYVDGAQRPNAFTSTLVPANYATNLFCVGTWNTSSYTNNFIGEIAEIRVWNYAISPIQIASQWQNNIAANSSGLVAYYTNYPVTPTTGSLSASAPLTNTASGGISLQLYLGGSGANPVNYDIVNKPTMYSYTGASYLNPQHTLAYSTIYGNTSLGNAGNLWIGMGNYTFSVSANNIAWNGNVWVGVGQGGNTLAYSPDGFTWFGLGNTIFSGWGNSLAWNGSFWVAVGYGANTLAYSPDGVQWTGLGGNTFSVSGNGVNWNGTMWVAAGSGANTLAYSMDGLNWTGLGRSTFAIQGNDVASNIQGTMWVAAGQSSTISGIGNVLAWSSDGINWNKPTGNIYSAQNIFTLAGTSVAHTGRFWVATGIGGNTVAYSPDGNTWTGEGTGVFNYNANRVVWNQGLGSVTFKTNYTTTTGLALTAGTSSQPLWVAAGSPYGITTSGFITGNTLGYSRTGLTWFGLGNTVFYTAGQFVAYNGVRWVAGGVGANTMAYSNNGINWIGLGSNLFSVKGIFAKWNGYIWVAVGQGGVNGNTLGWSADGINWNGLGNGIFSNYGASVEWNGMMWVAGGNNAGFTAYGNTLAYSFNGMNWIGLGGNLFSLSCNSITWTGYMWLGIGGSANWTGTAGPAVGSGSTGNTLAYSINGFNWFGITNSFFNGPGGYGQSLAYNGKIFVASGFSGNAIAANVISMPVALGGQQGNTLIYSFNGFNWNVAYGSINVFTNVCYTTKWDGKIFIAGGQAYSTGIGGGNSIAYSYNGNTWIGIGNNVFSGNVFGVACKNLFGNKIQLDNAFVSKSQALEVVSDSAYQVGYTGSSVYVNARPFTSAVNPLVINSNFATVLYPTNTANLVGGIFGWNVAPIQTGQNLLIANGTGGSYGFLYCPSPQFLIIQTIINSPIILTQTIFINPGTYTLSFYAAPRSNYNTAGFYSPTHQLTVTLNSFGLVTNFTSNTNPWTQFSFQFTITTPDYYVLQFQSYSTIITDTSIGLTEIAIF
jgi:hypothetical protein